jgi:uncharacterized SAM-binding protein YcdF (DUF218 family)
MRPLSLLLKLIGLVTVLGTVLGAAGLLLAGYWLAADDEPHKADAIVVLAGDFGRPLYAADLYLEGYAPLVFLADPPLQRKTEILRQADVPMPRHAEVYRRLLVKKGVPGEDIRIYGRNVTSTAEEAEALADVLGDAPMRILLVTSPYHVRRAKFIVQRTLPNARITALGSPYEDFPKRWWADRQAAINVVLECAKFAYYLAGGRFRYGDGQDQTPPAVDTAPSG